MPKKKEAPLAVSDNSDNVSANTLAIMQEEVVLGKNITHLAKLKKQKGRIIAIVGFAETSRNQVLAEPDTTEIWSLNRCYTFLKRWDRHFEIHEEDLYSGKTGLREDGYLDLLRSWDCPIYMQHPDPSIPTAQLFPLKEIIANFREYFTTSVAYMLAMVAYEHKVLNMPIAEVHMYGIDMSAFSEYSEQLPCVNYWLGVVEGLIGKDAVVIPSVSPLLKCAMQYGRHGERPLQKMAKERLQHHKERQAQLTSDLSAVAGISSEYGNFFKYLDELIAEINKEEKPPVDLINTLKEACKNRRNEITKYHSQVNAELNAELGGLRETQHWMVALNAKQDAEEEPVSAKIPQL